MIIQADARTIPLAPQSVQMCVTSPPYFGLRDYGHDGQIGLENSIDEYVSAIVGVMRQVWRVLKDDGTLWLNLGDSYNSGGQGASGFEQGRHRPKGTTNSPPPPQSRIGVPSLPAKNLIGIPWRVAFALQADGWYLRQDIIWHKPNPMPESVRDRCTKAHEYIFLLTKRAQYYFDQDAIAVPSVSKPRSREKLNGESAVDTKTRGFGSACGTAEKRNKRSVWTVATQPYAEAHFACYPPKLIEPCILAGSRPGDILLDPFSGSGTTAEVCIEHQRRPVMLEINPEYIDLQKRRTNNTQVRLFV